MKSKYIFKIGHPSYNGANARADADTRMKAIAILRERGITRAAARIATGKDYSMVQPRGTFDVIEVMRIEADLA